jgi:hypothetical protein
MPSVNFSMNDVFPSNGFAASHGMWGGLVYGRYGGVFIPYYDDDPMVSGQNQIMLESYNYYNRKDVPEFTYSILNAVNNTYLALTTDEKPTNFSIAKATKVLDANSQTVTFTVTMNLNVTNAPVTFADEG